MVTEETVREALRNVYDPEVGISVQDLGLIYEVNVDGTSVEVIHSLTSAMCPFADEICENIEVAVSEISGVEKTVRKLTFDPPFSVDMVPEDTRMIMGWY
jgi:metal-sulfur cluster biosynthetic enzyme